MRRGVLAGLAGGIWRLERVFKRLNAWPASGKWLEVFQALVVHLDTQWFFIDGSYPKAHQHSAGAASGKDEAIGKIRAGISWLSTPTTVELLARNSIVNTNLII